MAVRHLRFVFDNWLAGLEGGSGSSGLLWVSFGHRHQLDHSFVSSPECRSRNRRSAYYRNSFALFELRRQLPGLVSDFCRNLVEYI